MKIVLIHHLNNYSGSPNVLSVIARELINRNHQVHLITNKSKGFLSNISNLKYLYVNYNWDKKNKYKSLFALVLLQVQLFFRLLFMSRKNIYLINTAIPFGAIIACAITRKNYTIHVHENLQKQNLLYRICRNVYRKFNKKTIFVSKYVKEQAGKTNDSIIAYNGLNTEFTENIQITPIHNRKTILMVCSLRSYKGIFQFIKLSHLFPNNQFELVVSETSQDVELFKQTHQLPNNITIYPSQQDVHPFYRKAKIVLNLSLAPDWIETFGLTILEALSYAIPVIYPNIGGPIEVGEDNISGFAVNTHNIEEIASKIKLLCTDSLLYKQMANNALKRSKEFDSQKMVSKIEKYILQ